MMETVFCCFQKRNFTSDMESESKFQDLQIPSRSPKTIISLKELRLVISPTVKSPKSEWLATANNKVLYMSPTPLKTRKSKNSPWRTPTIKGNLTPFFGRLLESKESLLQLNSTERGTVYSPSYSSFVPIPMTKILPHLWLGSYENASNEAELREAGISHIISLIGHKTSAGFVQHEHIPMNDYGRTDLKEVLEKVSKFAMKGQQDSKNVLVHCHLGQNRSPTVVIALLMKNEKKTLYYAHKWVKERRPLVQIHPAYAKQLLALEKEIFGKNSLPPEWMENGGFDMTTGEIKFKYENMNSEQHRSVMPNIYRCTNL